MLLFLWVVLFEDNLAQADNKFNTILYSVPFKTDEKTVYGNFFLAVPFNKTDKKVSEIVKNNISVSDVEQKLIELLDKVKRDDIDNLKKNLDPNNSMYKELGLKAYVNLFNRSIKKFSDMTIEGVIKIGPHYKVVVSGFQNGIKQFRLFTFKKVKKEYLYTDQAVSDIDYVLNSIYRNGPNVVQKDVSELEIKYKAISISDNGEQNYELGTFYFNGESICYKLKTEKMEQSMEKDIEQGSKNVLDEFLNESNHALLNKEFIRYLNYFEPISRKRLKDQFEKMTSQQLESWVEESKKYDKEYFYQISINENLLILFYRSIGQPGGDNYVYISNQNGSYHYLNVSSYSSIDKLLKGRNFMEYVNNNGCVKKKQI